VAKTNRFVSRKISDVGADHFPTHPLATQALLKYEKFEGEIWEPACGDGAISRILKKAGYRVRSSDLYDYGYGKTGLDFLSYRGPRVDNIITNPPFKKRGTERFIRQALRCSKKKVAIFCRFLWLGAGNPRADLLKELNPSRIYVLGRVKMGPKQRRMIDYCWLVWDREYKGPTLFFRIRT
jgi:hypothetical protein